MLERLAPTKGDREAQLLRSGYQAYTTSVGWMGYTDEAIRNLCRQALSEGWTHFKVKVGSKPEDDRRRVAAVRDAIGPDHKLMIDANQAWDVNEAIERINELARFNLWWAEEPTHPDDVLGHATIASAVRPLGIGVATGEHCANRIVFKQLLQARKAVRTHAPAIVVRERAEAHCSPLPSVSRRHTVRARRLCSGSRSR
jgi:L-fuconate dehydratase